MSAPKKNKPRHAVGAAPGANTKQSRPKFSSATTATEAQRKRVLNALRIGPKTSHDLRRMGSYLPDHLIEAAQSAMQGQDQAAHQHAFNAMSTACWHIARGEVPQALARLRRARSHMMASMEGRA